jgi:hypothetical protein
MNRRKNIPKIPGRRLVSIGGRQMIVINHAIPDLPAACCAARRGSISGESLDYWPIPD